MKIDLTIPGWLIWMVVGAVLGFIVLNWRQIYFTICVLVWGWPK